jgi:hypothetical protein
LSVGEEAEMLFFIEALLGFITFSSIGWICLVWPERVQEWGGFLGNPFGWNWNIFDLLQLLHPKPPEEHLA